ncbi:MAG: hypothetical protein HY035_04320 [Nitrospirae bacterium]|nr:hypothetical protein [Nitrospirota bacterium]MBI3377614.1 hypothetical protein [Nitrospirota bacterium]
MINKKDLFEAMFSIALGLYALIFLKWHIKSSVSFQKKLFGLDVNSLYFKIAYPIAGIFFIVFGILLLFGYVKLGK